MKKSQENKKNSSNFWWGDKWWRSVILSIIIGVIVGIAMQYVSARNFQNGWDVVIKSFFSTLLSFLFIKIPTYLIDTQNHLRDEITKAISRIDECPRMMALHTDGKVLESQINKINESNESNVRWIMSKYISKLLSVSIKSFCIDFKSVIDIDDDSKATAEYSKFSSEIIKECKESVKLTGSMTPHEWLSNLAVDKENQKRFFNNEVSELIIDDSNNHSRVLKNSQIDEKKRIVCLPKFDYDNLFLFENSIEAYYKINDGIPTKFISWDENIKSHMNPLQYEYALYDDSLLFKFDKETKVLEIQNGGNEFDEIRDFFNNKGNTIETNNHDEKNKLIQRSHDQKQKLIKQILRRKQIPHKYSYLFDDEWERFLRRSDRYSIHAKKAIEYSISNFLSNKKRHILEIGPGNGDKIDMVCDCIGTDNIIEYELVDISSRLLKEARAVLNRRFDKNDDCNCDNVFDVCDDNIEPTIFDDKTVLILNNSTIFPEINFPWKSLTHAEDILITLDLYDNNADVLFDEYYKARELFLSPMKIFEIPIVSELIDGDEFKFLFSDNSKDEEYSNENPFYNIYFNLKAYLDIISFNENQKSAESIAKTISCPSEELVNIRECIMKYRRNHTSPLKWKSDSDQEYSKQSEKLYSIDKLIILSSLKFKKESMSDYKTSIKKFFTEKLGDQFYPRIDDFKHVSSSYVGIYLERKSNNGNQHYEADNGIKPQKGSQKHHHRKRK